MGWDERLFGALFRALRRRPRGVASEHAVTLEPIRARLRTFGGLIAGRPVEIGIATGGEGRRGRIILVPTIVDLAPDVTVNESILRLRVAIAAASFARRLDPPSSLSRPGCEVFTLLALSSVLDGLEREIPGVAEAFHVASPLVLRGRSWPSAAGARSLEALTRRRLGVSWDELEREGGAVATRWARAADASIGATADAASLASLAENLASSLGGGTVAAHAIWGTIVPRLAGEDDGQTDGTSPADSNAERITSERKGRPREGVRRVTLDESRKDENPLTHSFEKVHTAEEYQGGSKTTDGSDELAEHGDALDEVDMREVVRTKQAARSIYRADVLLDEELANSSVDQATGEGILYDEWNASLREYHRGHCALRVTRAEASTDAAGVARAARAIVQRERRHVRAIEDRLLLIERTRHVEARQPDGTDIDIDAVVDRLAALAAKHTGTERLYVRRRPREQSLAVFILLDASLSTDAWVGGRRVLDVAKESLVILGDVFERLGIECAVSAFYSHTRRDCRFVVVKTFEDNWPSSLTRLASVAPTGYTRIGPALRHAARTLEESGARKKLLVVVTDGKPSDYDRYEGRYGIGDIKQAVFEAEQRGVHTFALALDAGARRYLPDMFGPSFEVVTGPEGLATGVGRLCGELGR